MSHVLVIPEEGVPFLSEYGGTLKELQKLVGGYIECITVRKNKMVAVVNEKGMLNGMTFNRTASVLLGSHIYGPMVLMAVKLSEDGEKDIVGFESKESPASE